MKTKRTFILLALVLTLLFHLTPIHNVEADEPVTLLFYSNEANLSDKYDLINAEYMRRNPHVKIEMVYVAGADYAMKVDTTILSGQQLDICFFNLMSMYAPRAMQGEFYNMDELLENEGIKLSDVYNIDATLEDGSVYALPGDVKPWLVWINKNDLEEVGLEIPPLNWTWDDYREYAKKLTWGEGVDKHYGSLWHNWDHYNVWFAYNKILDNPYINPDGTHNINNPAFRESIEYRRLLELEDKTQLPLSEIKAMQLDYRSVFMQGRASMLVMASNIIPQIANIEDYPHDFVTTFASMPIPADGNPGVVYTDNRFYSIGATTVNALEAYKYLRFFTTEGIPMKNLTFTAEKQAIVTTDEMAEKMTSVHPELFDVTQLKKVLGNPDLKMNIWQYVPSYTDEIVQLYWSEADKCAMGEITVDELFDNVVPQIERVLEKNR